MTAHVSEGSLASLNMEFDLSQLSALSAAVSEGTLDGAARALHVTPSAVSQRLKALEQAAGRVLLVRSKPVRVTPSGEPVLRLARQVALLVADARRELDGDARPVTIPLAINADSLATWVLDALVPLGRFAVLRHPPRGPGPHQRAATRGDGHGGDHADAEPVPGCSSSPLGSMRYRCMASPGFRGALVRRRGHHDRPRRRAGRRVRPQGRPAAPVLCAGAAAGSWIRPRTTSRRPLTSLLPSGSARVGNGARSAGDSPTSSPASWSTWIRRARAVSPSTGSSGSYGPRRSTWSPRRSAAPHTAAPRPAR